MNDFEKDDAPLVTREGALIIRGIDEKKRTADFIASTEAIDSYDEIVEQDWILDRFRTNPVILFGHNSRALPIGKALRCEVVQTIRGPQLECTIEFATAEMNPEAERVWQLVKGEFLRAVSVGFRPKSIRYEKRNDKEVYILSQNVLHEISVVTIPANPEALAKDDPLAQMKAKAVASANDKAAEELDASFRREMGVPPSTPTPAHESGTEKTMDPKEMKAALEAKTGELAVAKDKIESHEKTIEQLRAKAVEAEARATEAETTLTKLREQHVAFQQLSSEVDAALKSAGAPTEVAVAEPKAGEPATKGLTIAERITAVAAQRDKAIDTLTERDVDDLIGVKIVPAQKEKFLKLAKKDRESFDDIVKDMPDLKLLGQVIPAAKGHASTANASDNGEGLAELLGDGATKSDASEPGDLADMLED